MIRPKSRILKENLWYESDALTLSKDNITIKFSGYDNHLIDPYIKVYKNINTPFMRMCRLSLINPRYIKAEYENLLLSKKELSIVLEILEKDWKDILHRYLGPFYSDTFADRDNIDQYMEENGWKITGNNFDSIIMPDYRNSLSTIEDIKDQSDIILKIADDYCTEVVNYLYDEYMNKFIKKDFVIYSDENYKAYAIYLYKFPAIRIQSKYNKMFKFNIIQNLLDFSIVNKEDFEDFELHRIPLRTNYIFEMKPFEFLTSNDYQDYFPQLLFDVYDFVYLAYYKKKGLSLQEISYKQF